MSDATLTLGRRRIGLGIIGRNLDPNAPRFPGPLYQSIGFGIDLPADAERTILATLNRRPKQGNLFRPLRFKAEDVREQYRRNVLKSFADSRLPLNELMVNEVTFRLHGLMPERVYSGLTIDKVIHQADEPEHLDHAAFPEMATWRHHQFATMIIGRHLPHIRTSEMLLPDHVWSRIKELLERHCTGINRLFFSALDPEEQQKEYLALAFAAYEQLLQLRCAEALATPQYRQAISDRTPETDVDPILALDKMTDLTVCRHERQFRYHELLVSLSELSVNTIRGFVPLPVNS